MSDQAPNRYHMETIQVPGMHKLLRTQPSDERLYFKDMRGDESPLEPLPVDALADLEYDRKHEPKCQICTSPYRKVVEHIFIGSGGASTAVTQYFWKYYNRRIHPEVVTQHMRRHCVLEDFELSGLSKLSRKAADYNQWVFREDQLAIISLMEQMDRIGGISTSNADMKLRISAELRQLNLALLKAKEIRDADLSKGFNMFQFLTEIMQRLEQYPEAQGIVRQMSKEAELKVRGTANRG